MRAHLTLMAVGLVTLGCSENQVATRAEAIAECGSGCAASIANNPSKPEIKRRYCDEICSCVVESRFTSDGKQVKATKEELEQQMRACIDRTVKTIQWSPSDPIL